MDEKVVLPSELSGKGARSVKQKVLIAEPNEILRCGLRSLLIADERISSVQEATSFEEFQVKVWCCPPDLTIIDQSLLKERAVLAKGNFVILATEPDISVIKSAYKNGVRAYLSKNSSAELLRIALGCERGSFLIDPTFLSKVFSCLFDQEYPAFDDSILTRREREIISLLREGIDRRAIAQRLHIAEATLNTHIKNINRKRKKAALENA